MRRHLCLIAAIVTFHLAYTAPISGEHLPEIMEGPIISSNVELDTYAAFLPNNEILSVFSASFVNNQVHFEWKVLGVSDAYSSIRYFAIERMVRADYFMVVGGLKERDFAIGNRDYEINDANPPEQHTIKYRLKIVMDDGTIVYSKIQTVYTHYASTLQVMHNHEKNLLRVSLKEKRSTPFTLNLYDFMGKQALSIRIEGSSSAHIEKEINTAGLASGMYILTLTNGSDSWQAKIFKR